MVIPAELHSSDGSCWLLERVDGEGKRRIGRVMGMETSVRGREAEGERLM